MITSHYYGVDGELDPREGDERRDADTQPGQSIPAGNTVTWTYVVTNGSQHPGIRHRRHR